MSTQILTIQGAKIGIRVKIPHHVLPVLKKETDVAISDPMSAVRTRTLKKKNLVNMPM